MNSDICKLKCSSFSQTETLLFYYSSLYFSFVPFEIGEWLMVWRKNSIASSLSHATTIFHQKIKKSYHCNKLSILWKAFHLSNSSILKNIKTTYSSLWHHCLKAIAFEYKNAQLGSVFPVGLSIDGILDKWTPNNKYHIPFVQKER